MSATWLSLPLDKKIVGDLAAGQWVNLSGAMYTGRDAALARINELLLEGKTPPVELQGQLL